MLINDNQVTAEFDKMVEFNPMRIVPRQKGEWVTISGGTPSLATHRVSAESVIEGSDFDMNQLLVYSPDSFIAGQLNRNVLAWEYVLERSGVNEDTILRVRKWLTEGVDVTEFFTRFKGNFRGKSFDSELPPSAVFPNSALCKKYHAFICDVLYEKIRSGAIRVLGKVGECEMPHIVMPLTIEPSKPRLCHDDRFLNLWVKDLPFQLETLRDVHRLVGCNAFLITTDEKSGYDHVRLSNDSQGYFGLIFGGYVMVYTVIPFGFKASPFIYQTIGMVVTSYLRSRSISTVQYIDDRLAIANVSGAVDPYVEGCKVAYILVEVLTRLGYTLALRKCSFVPLTCVKFLGFLVDSKKQAYILPECKKLKFADLRESILGSKELTVKTLQRFAGKCISMGLAVPGCRLFCREVNLAISRAVKSSKHVCLTDELREELEHWRFLDSWEGCCQWRSECHQQVMLSSDASLYKYGAVVEQGRNRYEISDFWEENDQRPIHLKEADAVYKVLLALGENIANSRVHVLTDNMAVLSVWQNQGGKDRALNCITKCIFSLTLKLNFELNLQFVPSKLNEADAPSRQISYADSMLDGKTWGIVEKVFGPHTVDLMASDSNSMKAKGGGVLRHFTPCPMPFTAGVDVFAQNIRKELNPYVFPPFGMVFPVLSFLKEQEIPVCTCILPYRQPVPVWQPLVEECKISSVVLGWQGEKGVIRVPTKKGYVLDNKGLKWALIAYRLTFSENKPV